MDNVAKVTLSNGELSVASNKDIILTKRTIIETASLLFSNFTPQLAIIFKNTLNPFKDLAKAVPKITKGENYNDLPYVILDYPAVFKKENIFALRSMFWWGNFISITLHLSGEYKLYFEKNIFKNLSPDFYVCTNETQWQHHFDESNYKMYSTLSKEEMMIIKQKEFIKIALKYELHHWNMMQSLLPEGFEKLNMLLIN
jgi:hypothetical protein